uniref:V-SNARE coiled-coil homology domain-containing protein n=1 Tax=Amphora coffeiformis TaxID=265554 RepID=A0A7S3L4N4_9STRA|mmetsp:Transcript_3892/g.7738  ORF Transcript_3892/g.7738 Transcript_3892/m.7738 type:complete len:239 (+) Transcript_3892:100-816(+)|eukprot:scaffold3043_cov180-Amphora_coffeaeformis.AAC.17
MMSSDYSVSELQEKVLWSCIARNDVILVEAGEDNFDGAVTATAQGILQKKGTAGWEYYKPSRSPFRKNQLKGVKFHFHESAKIIWVFAAVYNPQYVQLVEVQSFIEKIMGITEMYRDEDPTWRTGPKLACQPTFAPILIQRMEEVTYLGKMAMISQQLDTSKQIMQDNITRILENEEKIDDLAERGTRLEQMASDFKKRTKGVRRKMMIQNAKHGALVGGAITAGVAVVVVPPLVALL